MLWRLFRGSWEVWRKAFRTCVEQTNHITNETHMMETILISYVNS